MNNKHSSPGANEQASMVPWISRVFKSQQLPDLKTKHTGNAVLDTHLETPLRMVTNGMASNCEST